MQTNITLVNQKKILGGIMLFSFFISNVLFAQSNYSFTNYTQEHGLASSTLTGITKDSTGFLWLMSENGLTRFDGYDFKVFRNNPSDSSSISSPYILGMFIDSAKNIFVRTSNSISKYNQNESTFSKIVSFSSPTYFSNWLPGISNLWITVTGSLAKINVDKNNLDLFPFPEGFTKNNSVHGFESKNYVWISDNKTILKFDKTKNKFFKTNISYNKIPQNKLTQWIILMFENSNGQCCFYSHEGLFIYNTKTNSFERVCKGFIDIAIEGNMTGKLINSNHQLFISMRNGNLHCINTQTGADSVINLKAYCAENLKKDFSLLGIHISLKNSILISTASSGIFKYDIQTNLVTQFAHDNLNTTSLSSNGCNAILDDDNGILWISLPGIGLAKGEPDKTVFKSYAPETGIETPTASTKNNIRKIFEYDTNHLLILSLDGCFLFNKQTSAFSRLINPVDLKPYLIAGAYGDAVYDSDSTLWIASWSGNGLFAINSKKKKTFGLTKSNVPGFAPIASTRSLYVDSRKNMWIGTANNTIFRFNTTEINLLNPAVPHIDVFNSKILKNDSLIFNIIFSITENNNGEIIFGTQNGLYSYSYSANKFRKFASHTTLSGSISNDDVRAVCIDKKNVMWLGTNGGGLNRFDEKTKTFVSYKTENGLPDNIIYSIVEDNKGFLWLGTNKGLCRFDKEKISSRNYSIKDGIQNYEFNTNAACKTKNGELVFGGVNGFNMFNPDSVATISVPPKVIITLFKVGDKEKYFNNKKINLKHNENYLSFQFAALNYFRNSENQFAYKLEGLDLDWVYCGTRRFTNYANLSPGNYTFRIKAANCYGEWNESATALHINISTPWYNTWSFQLALLLFVSGIVYAIFRIRLNQKLKFQEVRNKIARDLHDEIGSNLSSISLFSAVAKEHVDDVNNSVSPLLKKIIDYTQASQEAMNDIVWMINARNDSFENIIVRMRALAAELFEAKNVNLHLHFDERLNTLKMGMDERKNFYLIYKEALNNIIKYAGCENVWIDLHQHHSTIVLKIKDDGKGFDLTKKYSGNGLLNMHNRTEALHGKLNIDSKNEKGTVIELIFGI